MMTTAKTSGEPLFRVRGLTRQFARPGHSETGQDLAAIEDVSLDIGRGEILGLVGESGSGKTTLARTALQLIRPDRGSVRLEGRELVGLNQRALRSLRSRMQIIFQEPGAALSPRRTVAQTLAEPLQVFGIGTAGERGGRMREALRTVGLDEAALERFPYQFSSGQRQRIMIARALICEPSLVVADEIVSALDVSIQAQILQLIRGLQADRGIAFLFISHDLAVIQQLADRVAVMYAGRLIETAPATDFFRQPAHPYARALLAAVPTLEPGARTPVGHGLPPLQPGPARNGCPYANRCDRTQPVCRETFPEERRVSAAGRHLVKCHAYPAANGESEDEPDQNV